jgi:hypothetical protein
VDKTVPGASPLTYALPSVLTGKIDKVTCELGAIPLGVRGDIERIERETRIKKGDERLDYWNGSGARPAEIGLPWLA